MTLLNLGKIKESDARDVWKRFVSCHQCRVFGHNATPTDNESNFDNQSENSNLDEEGNYTPFAYAINSETVEESETL